MLSLIVFASSFGASAVGAICGMGGGVVIRPVLDFFSVADVAAVSFLSGCTVLAMSGYNVLRSFTDRSGSIEPGTATPLALGAVAGGFAGSRCFQALCRFAGADGPVGAAQSIVMLILVTGTLVYTLKKRAIRPNHIKTPAACGLIGLVMGMLSAFLGIGGGPFYLVVLHFFLGQESKKAAANSLYIILFGQAAGILTKIICGAVPQFPVAALLLMAAGGISGSMAGRAISNRMDNRTVDRLFCAVMAVIVLICVYNTVRFCQAGC